MTPSGLQELNRYNLGIPQSEQNAGPQTIASAATIAPTSLLVFVTGTVQIATITPPMPGIHILITIHTNGAPVDYLTSGNILSAVDPLQNLPNIFIYDPNQRKYYGFATNLT